MCVPRASTITATDEPRMKRRGRLHRKGIGQGEKVPVARDEDGTRLPCQSHEVRIVRVFDDRLHGCDDIIVVRRVLTDEREDPRRFILGYALANLWIGEHAPQLGEEHGAHYDLECAVEPASNQLGGNAITGQQGGDVYVDVKDASHASSSFRTAS